MRKRTLMLGLILFIGAIAEDARSDERPLTATELYVLKERGELKHYKQRALRVTGSVQSVNVLGMDTDLPVVHFKVDSEGDSKTVQVEGVSTKYLTWLRPGDRPSFACKRVRGSDASTVYVAGCRPYGEWGGIKKARDAVKSLKAADWDLSKCRRYQSAGYLVCRHDRAMSGKDTGYDSVGNVMWRQCDDWLERHYQYCPNNCTQDGCGLAAMAKPKGGEKVLAILTRLEKTIVSRFLEGCEGQLEERSHEGKFAGYRSYNCTYVDPDLGKVREVLTTDPRGIVETVDLQFDTKHFGALMDAALKTLGKEDEHQEHESGLHMWFWRLPNETLVLQQTSGLAYATATLRAAEQSR